jgi:hypothetical protein
MFLIERVWVGAHTGLSSARETEDFGPWETCTTSKSIV